MQTGAIGSAEGYANAPMSKAITNEERLDESTARIQRIDEQQAKLSEERKMLENEVREVRAALEHKLARAGEIVDRVDSSPKTLG